MKNSKKNIEVSLTNDLYDKLMTENKNLILNLKESQIKHEDSISKQIIDLKNLKKELRIIKTRIKLTKRALRNEKRKLMSINENLYVQKDNTIYLNNTFILPDGKIYLNRFDKKDYPTILKILTKKGSMSSGVGGTKN